MPPAETPARPSQPFTPQPWRDRQMELVLGNLLRWGVLLSAAIVFAGACVYLSRHAHEPADYHIFRGEPSEFQQFAASSRVCETVGAAA